jgi:hypothetical protein
MKLFWVKHCGFSEDIWGKLRLSDASRGIMTYFVIFFSLHRFVPLFWKCTVSEADLSVETHSFSNNDFTHVFRWLNIINLASKENVLRYKECV